MPYNIYSIGLIKSSFFRLKSIVLESRKNKLIRKYLEMGGIPWSEGYCEYKTERIREAINDESLINNSEFAIPDGFGVKLDERIVEYPWIFNRLGRGSGNLLDAGSTFNFNFILDHPRLAEKKIFIYTFNPELNCYYDRGVSYIYGDLRDIPFRNDEFDIIVSQSTIEHIGMNNSIYGHNSDIIPDKNFEFEIALKEYLRILNHGGQLLLTFPFGRYENHSFFQQFDSEMVTRIFDILNISGEYKASFIKYTTSGWIISTMSDCQDSFSYNPHSGKGKSDDGAAHCRAICCIDFFKN